ncbi:S1 RNA-binding domain-containing protein [Eubacterium sp.]|jgi:predicted RNA-binding protein (virulence factor B family)|uniref:CvfB family protein n=1 Tax=Eubacterium sp. TaxID=142586 RepID=UPI002E9CA1E0|nr:S1-like domain-containing RNA-binding protein [Eubacterium sp.]
MELGKTLKLKVVKKTDFGIYLGTEDDKVLLPKNEVPQGTELGDTVEVFICRDSKDRLIATIHKPVAEVGETAYVEVKEITKFGAFLDWGLGKDLFLPYKEQTTNIKAGDKILVGIYTDKSDRLCATMKVYNYLSCNSTYEEEDIVKGVVYNYNPNYGAFVAVNNKYHGLIQTKELTMKVHVGMEVEARVKSVRPDGKLDLALRKKSYLQIEEDAEKILQFMKENGGKIDYTDKASPEVIKRDFNMSKSEFKRAIGRLLKEHQVIIGENNIFIEK